MDPDRYGYSMIAAALVSAMFGIGLVERKPRTDADRLVDIDKAEQAKIAYDTHPYVIAAAERRERRRLKRQKA